ncbi:hypothetical protein GTO91_01235 [Heliobacterium undosum]|uniref:YcdB/YcdC repeated domain-containing protein n=1 Tax=Heliomicrobium undosum TaxID=121734 RepID=A0A845L0R4_9FIRM|nr:YcdB/YcdC domain-containing protein [Heliomicrobium undosum]MZP28344.1 hypothetical protein [Heliomicrobium undosum]
MTPPTPIPLSSKTMSKAIASLSLALLIGQAVLPAAYAGADGTFVSSETASTENGAAPLVENNDALLPSPQVIRRSDQILKALMEFNPALAKLRVSTKELQIYSEEHMNWGASGRKMAWNIHLDGRNGSNHILISFDGETGDLIRFDSEMGNLGNDDTLNRLSRNHAIPSPETTAERATAFLKKAIGEGFNQYRLAETAPESTTIVRNRNEYVIRYRVARFYRLVHDIPVANSGWHIVVNNKGELVRAENRDMKAYPQEVFPPPVAIKSREELQPVFEQAFKTKLVYAPSTPGEDRSAKKARLVYWNVTPPIDAVTGKILPATEGTPERLQLKGKNDGAIKNEKDANKWVMKLVNVDKLVHIDTAGMELKRDNGSVEPEGRQYADYRWDNFRENQPNDGNNGFNGVNMVNLTVNEKTGAITNFYIAYQSDHGPDNTKLDASKARATALAFLEAVLPKGDYDLNITQADFPAMPDWVNRSQLPNDLLKQQQEYIYACTVNRKGVPDYSTHISVSVNKTTGKVTHFYFMEPSYTEYPDPSKVMAEEKAKEIFMKRFPLQLVYDWPEYFNQRAPQAKLQYKTTPEYRLVQIDAFTGEVVEQ